MAWLNRALSGCSAALTFAAGVFMVLMMAHVVLDVLSRWLMNYPIDGTLEVVSHYYMVALIYLPLAYVQGRNEHIAAEIFTSRLSGRPRSLLLGIVDLLMVAYCAVFVWTTSVEALRKTAEFEYLEATKQFIVIWPTRWFLPIGFGLMGLLAAVQAVQRLGGAATGRATSDAHTSGWQ